MSGSAFWALVIGLIVVNIPSYLLLGKVFFGGWEGFLECVRYGITPDIVSLFRGEYWEDKAASWKLFLYFAGCAALVFCEYKLISKIFS